MMNNEYESIDLSYLRTISDGSEDIIKELIEIFIEQIPEFTEGIQEHFQKKEWIALAGLAHKAKSSVISMGMSELGEVDLKNLELIAKNRRIKELNENGSGDDSANEEIERLVQNLEGYPEEKQNWVHENDQDETFKKIIDKFVATCDNAIKELNSILEN